MDYNSEPSSSPVDRIREIPVRSNKQISTLGYLPARLVQLYGGGGVILLEAEAVRALALVEDVRRELSALRARHCHTHVLFPVYQ